MRKLQFHPCGNFRETYQEEITIFETDFGRLWMLIGLLLLFGVIPFISSAYIVYVLNTIGIYAISAIGLNLLIGYTGQISLGHGAFFGVGAYAGAVLATKTGSAFLPPVSSTSISALPPWQANLSLNSCLSSGRALPEVQKGSVLSVRPSSASIWVMIGPFIS